MSLSSKRLKGVYEKSLILPLNENSKYIIMSDCHRGQGNNGDNFLPNQNMFFGALDYYYKNGFSYIELGDGDELWENRKMKPIKEVHSDAFWIMSKFYKEKRFHMIYGNHDIIKSKKSFSKKHCYNYFCEVSHRYKPLFPNLKIYEGIVLKNPKTKEEIQLAHGHQGDILNDYLWRFARFLVRYVWGPLELVGFKSPTGAGRDSGKKDKIERKLMQYANEEKRILICGHTHRPVFSKSNDSYYFNDGSCVHPRCITGIEIENNCLSLIKWYIATDKEQRLFVKREVLEEPISISGFYDNAI